MKYLVILSALFSMSAFSASYMDYSCNSNYRYMNTQGGSAMFNIYNSSTFSIGDETGVVGTLSEVQNEGRSEMVLAFYRKGVKLAQTSVAMGEELNLSTPINVGGLVLGSVSANCQISPNAHNHIAVNETDRNEQKDTFVAGEIPVRRGPAISEQ